MRQLQTVIQTAGRFCWRGMRCGNGGTRGRRRDRAIECGAREVIEKLEQRLLLADTGALNEAMLDWHGKSVAVVPGEWILAVKPTGSTGLSVQSMVSSAAMLKQLPSLSVQEELPAAGLTVIKAATDVGYDQLRSTLSKLPGFAYLEPNFILHATRLPNDPNFSQLYAMNNTGQTGGLNDADIDMPEAWDRTTGDGSVVVGVIDTGVDYTHPDLAANMWHNPGEIPGDGIDNDGNGYIDDVYGWDFVNNDNNPMDDVDHGTHVAGTIAAVGNNGIGVAGVNWNAKIMALKFLGSDGSGSTADAVSALNYATMMRGRGVNIRVTSNSWAGGEYSQALYDAIQASGNAGMLFVAAAGNSAVNTDKSAVYPADYDLPNIISVAATDSQDQQASFSNYGANTVDLGAPGVDILSTVPNNSYASFSGTSMATPHVAGVAALAWSLAPTASYQYIRDAILGGTDRIASMFGDTASGGRLNAKNTLDLVSATSPLVVFGAGDGWLSEPGTNTGTFVVFRFGSTATALTVPFSISGTATNGADYTLSATSFTIPAGATSASITVTPLDDNLAEGPETITLSLGTGGGYALGAGSTMSLRLDDKVPRPANNDFASATVISAGTTQVSGTNVDADKEFGEPNHAGNAGGASVWWKWTADVAGTVTINTNGSSFDTLLGVYTGNSVAALTLVAANDDWGSLTSQVTFSATLGTTYEIAVDGYGGATGSIAMGLASGPAGDRLEPNDSFAAATDLGTLGTTGSTTVGGLSIHAANNDDYFRFTPAAGGVLTADLSFINANGNLDMFIYNSSQTLLGSSTGTGDGEHLAATVTAGAIYYIKVAGNKGATNPDYTLSVTGPAIAADRFEPNDSFAAATDLGTPGTRTETGLSIHAVSNDDYFRFKANVSGTFSVDLAFNQWLGDLDLYLYSSTLGQLAASTGIGGIEHVAVTAVAGASYYVKVAGYGAATNPDYSLSIAGPSGAPDRFEPNDSFAQATDLGTLGSRSESGLSIHAPANDDYFKFTAAAGGDLDVDLSFVNSAGNLDLFVYDAGQNLIGSSAGIGDGEHVLASVATGGMYYVKVSGYSGAVSPSYTLSIAGPAADPDRFEPDDSFAQAADLGALGSRKEAGLSIHVPNNDDYYKVTAASSGNLNVGLTFSNSDGNLDLYVYDAAHSLVSSSTGVTDSERVSVAATAGAVYYVRVAGYHGATNPDYALGIVVGDRFEPNDGFAEATNFGALGTRTEAGLSIHTPGNDDYFQFLSQGSGTLTVDITFANANGNLDLFVYSAAQSLLGSSTGSGDGEHLSLSVIAGTTYYVKVAGAGGATNPSYTLSIAAPAMTADRFEPNNSFAQAANLGTLGSRTESGLSIHAPNDDDYYKLTAAASGLLSFDLSFNNALGDLNLFVYDGAYALLGSSIGTGNSEHVAISTVSAQLYYVKVSGSGGATNPNYALSISDPGGDRFEPNDSIAQATDLGTLGNRTESGLSISAPFNNDYYRFTAATSGLLNVNLSFNAQMGDLDLYLFNGNAVQIAASYGTTSSEHVSYSVTAGSNYYVQVVGYRVATNPAYTLQIAAALPAWLADDGALAYAFSGPPSAPVLTITSGHGRLIGDASAALPGLSVTVSPQASLVMNVDQKFAALQVGDGGLFAAAPGVSRVLLIDSLSLAPTARVDLATSDMVLVKGTSASFDAIRQYLLAGQISSSATQLASGHVAALAPVDNRLLHLTGWNGKTISTGTNFSQVIVKNTWLGDANLDGQVTAADYLNVIANQGKPGQWITGDLNGDGVVTPDDLAVVSANLGAGMSAAWGPSVVEAAQSSAMAAAVQPETPVIPAAAPSRAATAVAARLKAARTPVKKSGTISGVAFDDTNGDGVRQRSEELRRNAVVFLDTNRNGRLDAGEREAQTNSSGRYVFSDAPINSRVTILE